MKKEKKKKFHVKKLSIFESSEFSICESISFKYFEFKLEFFNEASCSNYRFYYSNSAISYESYIIFYL